MSHVDSFDLLCLVSDVFCCTLAAACFAAHHRTVVYEGTLRAPL
jgi:hypothetical protein